MSIRVRASDPDYEGAGQRRPEPLQRDWLGHTIYFLSTVVMLGIAVFGGWVALDQTVTRLTEQIKPIVNMQSALSTLTVNASSLAARVDRDERDIGDLRTSNIAQTTAVIDINKQLAIIGEQVHQLIQGGERQRR